MVPDLVNVHTLGVVDSGVVLNDTNNFSSILLEELGCPVADSAESLHNNSLASDAHITNARLFDEALNVEALLDAVVDTETSGLGTALDTTLGRELSCGTTLSVNVGLTVHVHVGVLDPGHDLFVGAEIRSETIDLGSNKSFLGEFHGVPSGDLLDLALRVLLGVDLDATLSTTEGHISNRQLKSHQGSKSHNLLQVHVRSVSSATLNWEFVVLVLGSVADDVLDASVVAADRDRESDDVVAGTD